MNLRRVLLLSYSYKTFLYDVGDFKSRLKEYAKVFDVTVIVFVPKTIAMPPSIKMKQLEVLFLPLSLNPLHFLKLLKIVSKLMRKNGKFQTISAQDPHYVGILGYLLKFIYRTPLNVQLHIDFVDNIYWIRERLIRKFMNIWSRFLLKKADSIRVVNGKIARKLENRLKIPSEKIFVAPIYTNLEKFYRVSQAPELTSSSDKPVILSVGRLVPQKNFINLIKAINKIRSEIGKAIFLIIGEGPELKALLSQIKKYDLEDNIQIIPKITEQQLIQLYHDCIFFVLPSNYEGWGLVCVEAMACEKAVIMTNTGCAGELVLNGQNGFIVPPNNPEKLATRILLLLKNEKKRTEMGKQSIKILEKRYDKNKYLNEFYKSLII